MVEWLREHPDFTSAEDARPACLGAMKEAGISDKTFNNNWVKAWNEAGNGPKIEPSKKKVKEAESSTVKAGRPATERTERLTIKLAPHEAARLKMYCYTNNRQLSEVVGELIMTLPNTWKDLE